MQRLTVIGNTLTHIANQKKNVATLKSVLERFKSSFNIWVFTVRLYTLNDLSQKHGFKGWLLLKVLQSILEYFRPKATNCFKDLRFVFFEWLLHRFYCFHKSDMTHIYIYICNRQRKQTIFSDAKITLIKISAEENVQHYKACNKLI